MQTDCRFQSRPHQVTSAALLGCRCNKECGIETHNTQFITTSSSRKHTASNPESSPSTVLWSHCKHLDCRGITKTLARTVLGRRRSPLHAHGAPIRSTPAAQVRPVQNQDSHLLVSARRPSVNSHRQENRQHSAAAGNCNRSSGQVGQALRQVQVGRAHRVEVENRLADDGRRRLQVTVLHVCHLSTGRQALETDAIWPAFNSGAHTACLPSAGVMARCIRDAWSWPASERNVCSC